MGRAYQEMFLILFGVGGFQGNGYCLSQHSNRYDSKAGSRGFQYGMPKLSVASPPFISQAPVGRLAPDCTHRQSSSLWL
ncbi:hypothetical protein BS47DRAFT_660577 [Hydnum rufescens UP504]|uniref:Uncharacterized protein n=1 Tax=Hydnum rufescens UP504 TaxID=1448309 RepID=A0A9P6DH92_9AGAM|nr:hypothetical protein BS47DRAFT_660577 [Hydnum rufescens UP504]